MPTVPRYESNIIPGTPSFPKEPIGPSEKSRAIGNIGRVLSDMGLQMKYRRDAAEVVRAELFLYDGLRKAGTENKKLKGRNAFGLQKTAEKQIEDLNKHINEKVLTNDRQRAGFSLTYSGNRNSWLNSMARHEAAEDQKNTTAMMSELVVGTADFIQNNSGNPGEIGRVIAEFGVKIEEMNRGMNMTGYIYKNVLAFKAIAAKALQDNLKSSAWEMANRINKVSGYEEAVKYLHNDARKAGLNQESINALEADIGLENTITETKRREAKEKATEDESRAIGRTIEKGDLLKARQLLSNSTFLSGDAILKWTNAIEAKANGVKIESSSPDVYRVLRSKALNGRISDIQTGVMSLVGTHLTKDDADYIVQINKDAQNTEIKDLSALTNEAYQALEERIKQGSSFMGYSPPSADKSYKAGVQLRNMLREEKDHSKQRDMLNPESKNYVIDKIVARYSKKGTNALFDSNALIEKLMEIDKKVPPKKDGRTSYAYHQINPTTKEIQGSNDGITWHPIP